MEETELSQLIESLVMKGAVQLDDKIVKSEFNVCEAHDLIWVYLKKDHAQIRYTALHLADVLFTRSALFRTHLVAQFPTFLALVVGGPRGSQPLPLPKLWAERVRRDAVEIVKKWEAKFGGAHKQERTKAIQLKKFRTAVEEMRTTEQSILENVEKMNGCFEILGLDTTVPPTSSSPTETPEPAVLFSTLRECAKVLVNKHLPLITRWIGEITRAGGDVDTQAHDQSLRKVIDLKQAVEGARKGAARVGVVV
ncbi:hypothetical protein HK104_004038, partial [Borealophlyctis nickersoniae]